MRRHRWNCFCNNLNNFKAAAINGGNGQGGLGHGTGGGGGGGGGALPICYWKYHLITAVLLLTGVNVYLLIQLLACKGGDHAIPPLPPAAIVLSSSAVSPARAAASAVFPRATVGRRDASSQFIIRDHFVTGDRFEAKALQQGVCLATQSSLDRLLRWFLQAHDHWRGAASVSVFLEGVQELKLFEAVVLHLRRCHAQLFSDVSFHVVVATSDTQVNSALKDESRHASTAAAAMAAEDDFAQLQTMDCTSPSTAFNWLIGSHNKNNNNNNKGGRLMTVSSSASSASSSSPTVTSLRAKWLSSAVKGGRPYPQNLMRNVARKGCPAAHVLLLDVDVIPSLNMAQSLSAFLLQQNQTTNHWRRESSGSCLKCAFVLPTYELDERSAFPSNKWQLLQLVQQGKAQAFHHKTFHYANYASNLSR